VYTLELFSAVFRVCATHTYKAPTGWVQTDMGGAGGRTAPTSVAQSAEGIAQLIDVASSIQRKQQMEQAPAGTTTGMASSYLGSIPTQFANFAKKFGESRCVFVAFDGELLPW